MTSKEELQLATVDVSKVQGSVGQPSVNADDLLVKQTRVRRLFTQPQLFSFSASYLITWISVGSGIYYALLNGGPAALLFNYIIVVVGALAQAASFAELASIQPVAGAQYYWTYKHAPAACRRLLTWIQGWTTWFAFIACLASAVNGFVVLVEAGIAVNFPSYEVEGWKTFLIFLGQVCTLAAVNIWCWRLVPWFELLAGILNVVLFFIFIVALWVMAPRNDASFLMQKNVSSGWENYSVAWNIGILSAVWNFAGFECLVHMGEETNNPRIVVPRGLVGSIVINGFIGLVMLITVVICMPPDIELLLESISPLVTIMQYGTGSDAITTVLITGITIMSFSSNLATFSSATRLTWAWARDGGLPQFFGIVNGGVRVPTRAIGLTSILVTLIALLNLGSSTYVALGAITSMAVIAYYMSYAIMLAVVLAARFSKDGFTSGEWTMGPRLGLLVNVFGLVYTCWALIFIPFPSILPVTAANMNWSLPVYVSVMVLAMTAWFMWARKNWPGPNERVAKFVLGGA